MSVKQFIQFLGVIEDRDRAFSSPLVEEELEQALLACLLKGFPHNYSDEILYNTGGAFALYVRKARAFIESHLHEDIHLGDIAAAVGVCPRLLQKAFAQHCGCSPMRFLTKLRLYRIRQDLEQATSSTKIVDVMSRYGLMQGGKFAKDYYQLFGEKPSATLKRSSAIKQRKPSLWEEIGDCQSELLQGGRNFPVGYNSPRSIADKLRLSLNCQVPIYSFLFHSSDEMNIVF